MASSRFLFIIVILLLLLATFIHQTDAAVTVSLNTVSSWNGGSQLQVVVKNTGPKPVCAVKIELSTPSGPPTTTTTTIKPNPGGGGSGGGGCCPYGKLAVRGTQLVGSNGQPVQLRGMSLFWSQLPDGAPFFNEQTLKCLKCNWRANVVRDTMTVEDNGQWERGYLSDPAKEYAKMEAVVDAAIKNCMYVLVDWHTTTGAIPPVDRAVDFFKRISAKCAGKCNCLYETWNEPVQVDWSSQVKPYHEKVLAAIRQNDKDGVVILGNPHWDHAQDQVAANPIMNQPNIMYTLHFYAAEQGQDQQRGIVQQAMQRGVPIFVTEYGTTMGTGDGSPNFAETNKWYQFLDANKISYINWSLGTKAETSSALRAGSTPADVCSDSKDTESGAFVKRMLREKNPAPQGC